MSARDRRGGVCWRSPPVRRCLAAAFSRCTCRPPRARPGAAQRELAAIQVDVIPDRPGQVLRQALQERLEGSDSSVARRYDLSVGFAIAGEGIAVQPDTIRDAHPCDRHRHLDPDRAGSGTHQADQRLCQAMDAINLIDEQYFTLDLENEAITAAAGRGAGGPDHASARRVLPQASGSERLKLAAAAGGGLPARSRGLPGRAAVWRRSWDDPRPRRCTGSGRRRLGGRSVPGRRTGARGDSRGWPMRRRRCR